MADTESPEFFHLNYEFEAESFSSQADWEAYATWLRRHLEVTLGLLPAPPRPPIEPEIFGRWRGVGYTCEKVFFESLPGFYVTGNLFRPTELPTARNSCPVILCPHGHWPDGRLHDRDVRGSVIARCIELARMGAVVFSYDMVGYNDSSQVPHRAFETDPQWGLSLMGLQTWNSIRIVDVLLDLPEADPKRVGVTGTSGGGTQTFMLMAVEDRITAAAPICMISLHMQGGCLCENAPLLRLNATNVELARMFAPKPLFVGSCTGDWTKNTPTVEFPAIRDIYAMYDAADAVSNVHVDAPHNYNQELRESVYGFFANTFFGADTRAPLPERDVARPPMRSRMVWWGRQAPKNVSPAEFRELWRTHCSAALKPHLADSRTVRAGLAPLLPHVLGIGPRMHEDAPDASSLQKGIDVRQIGSSVEIAATPLAVPHPHRPLFFDTYNRPPPAQRVHEILAAIDAAPGQVKLTGNGPAGIWCLLAAAVSDRVVALDVDMAGFDPDCDEAWTTHLNIPSIRQIGGLATVFAMVGQRELRLRNATDAVRDLAAHHAR